MLTKAYKRTLRRRESGKILKYILASIGQLNTLHQLTSPTYQYKQKKASLPRNPNIQALTEVSIKNQGQNLDTNKNAH